jgi:hypothetical protein
MLRLRAREDRPQSLQGHLIDQPDTTEVDAAGTLGDLLVLEELETRRPAVCFTELIGSAPAHLLSSHEQPRRVHSVVERFRRVRY